MQHTKIIIPFALVFVSTALSYMYGPISSIIHFDENYEYFFNEQYLFSGLVSSITICIYGYYFRLNFRNIFISLITSGILFSFLLNAGGANNLKDIFYDVLTFNLPFMVVAFIVTILLYFINSRWKRIGNDST
jgi:hypothetical protein